MMTHLNDPLATDWDLVHRWEWFRRSAWRGAFRDPGRHGDAGAAFAQLSRLVGANLVLDAYRSAYRGEPFVKVKGPEFAAGTSAVRGSNRCVVSVACDERTGTFRVLSYIDNLVKGQAGSAVQNLNVMFGLPETAGLDLPGPHP